VGPQCGLPAKPPDALAVLQAALEAAPTGDKADQIRAAIKGLGQPTRHLSKGTAEQD